MKTLQRSFLVLLCLAAVAAWAKPGPGVMPKRGKAKPKLSFGGVLQRGPMYSSPDAPPPASAIPNLIAASDPNNPNQIAAQSLGFSQSNCSGNAQAQAAALQSQLDALNAQAAAILAKVQSDYAHQIACSGTLIQIANCQLSWANQAAADAALAIPLAGQISSITAQLQALQAQASGCSGGSSPQAQAPAVTLQAAAKRFGFSLPSAAGQGGSASSFGPGGIGGSALEQLKELDAQGEGADWDGRSALRKSLGGYASAAQRAAAMGPLVQAGKQVAKENTTYDDPRTQAEAEYLKINYKELGSKYDSLVEERHQAALNVADQTLSSLVPMAPLPDEKSPALIDVQADEEEKLPTTYAEAAKQGAVDGFLSGAKEGFLNAFPDLKAAETVAEVGDAAVGGVQKMFDKLTAAVNQMGSVSQGTDDILAAIAAADKVGMDVGDKLKADPAVALAGLGAD